MSIVPLSFRLPGGCCSPFCLAGVISASSEVSSSVLADVRVALFCSLDISTGVAFSPLSLYSSLAVISSGQHSAGQ